MTNPQNAKGAPCGLPQARPLMFATGVALERLHSSEEADPGNGDPVNIGCDTALSDFSFQSGFFRCIWSLCENLEPHGPAAHNDPQEQTNAKSKSVKRDFGRIPEASFTRFDRSAATKSHERKEEQNSDQRIAQIFFDLRDLDTNIGLPFDKGCPGHCQPDREEQPHPPDARAFKERHETIEFTHVQTEWQQQDNAGARQNIDAICGFHVAPSFIKRQVAVGDVIAGLENTPFPT